NQVFKLLNEYNLTEAALNAGYWDQAHMIRDFKKMSGFTPAQIKKLDFFYMTNELRRDLHI
ncbi:helix-turn-helix domain-containing protein, partial [Anaerospora hongkongensis]